MKKTLYLILLSLMSAFQAQAGGTFEYTNTGKNLINEIFANVKGNINDMVPADASQFETMEGWVLKDVYAGDRCVYIKKGGSITFPQIKDLTGNAELRIGAEIWESYPENREPDYEPDYNEIGKYHISIENGELQESEFDLLSSMMISSPCMYGVSTDTRITLHADSPLRINELCILYPEIVLWNEDAAQYSPEPGLFYAPIDLNITSTSKGVNYTENGKHNFAVYTLDGTTPDRTSPRVTGPIHLDKTTTVQVGTVFGNGALLLDKPHTYEFIQASAPNAPSATYEINVSAPGQLKNQILDLDADIIEGLILKGKINSADLSYLISREGRVARLTYLDMEDVTLDYDGGRYKTEVYAPEGGMGTVSTFYYYLSATNYNENAGGGGPMATFTNCYRNDLSAAFTKEGINNVIAPKILKSIGERAFSGVEYATIPEGVEEIGNGAFGNAKYVNLPSSVRKIGDYALNSLLPQKIDLPNLEYIGESAFSGSGIIGFEFSDKISYIGKRAFSSTGLLEVAMSMPSDTIPESLFQSCKDLKKVNIKGNARYIGDYAFHGCDNIVEFNISKDLVDEVGTDVIPDYLLDAPEGGIYYIGKAAYKRSEDLTEYTVKEGTISLSKKLFYWSPLEKITLPSSLRKIGNHAFTGTKLTSTPDMNGVTGIGDEAFANCSDLARATIPESVQHIGYSIFNYCPSLWSLTYNAIELSDCEMYLGELDRIVIGDKVRVIPKGLFTSNNAVTEVILPASVEVIDENAFYNCRNLKSVYLSDNVTTIRDYAFAYCYALEDFHWPANLKSVGNQSFRECSALKTISLPEGMETVGGGAFQQCYNVESIYIASTITDFGGGITLYNTGKDFTITATATVPQDINWNWHYNGTPTIKVPAASLEAYKADPIWSGSFYMKDNLIIPIEGISAPTKTTVTTFGEGISEDTDLSDTVIGDVYVTLGENDSYDAEDGSIVLSSTIDSLHADILGDLAPGASDLANRFNGLVVMVGPGEGVVNIDCKTVGDNLLTVKMGNVEPQTYTQDVKGIIEIPYKVAEATYVYIYGSLPVSNALNIHGKKIGSRANEEGCIRLYSVAVNPDESSVEIIGSSDTKVDVYNLQGILIKRDCTREDLNQLPPAIYVLYQANGKSTVFIQRAK